MLFSPDAFDTGKLKGRGGDVKKMRDESIWLKDKMQQLSTGNDATDDNSVFEFQKGCQFAFEKVMAHNDLLSGNILINNDYDGSANPNLTIIDYEYTCYNARAFDLGNHFCGRLIMITSPTLFVYIVGIVNILMVWSQPELKTELH
jgi:hypothetical protein